MPETTFDINLEELSEDTNRALEAKPVDKAIHAWLTGDTEQSPQQVNALLSNLEKKMFASIGYITVENMIVAQQTIKPFIEEAYKSLFSRDVIASLPVDELLKVVQHASKTYDSHVETARKFLQTNRGQFTERTTEEEELLSLLSSMSPDSQRALIDTIRRQNENPVAELVTTRTVSTSVPAQEQADDTPFIEPLELEDTPAQGSTSHDFPELEDFDFE